MRTCGHFRATIALRYFVTREGDDELAGVPGQVDDEPDRALCAGCAARAARRLLREGFTCTAEFNGAPLPGVVVNPPGHRADSWWPYAWHLVEDLESTARYEAAMLRTHRPGAAAAIAP